ncbi:MAG TPA: PAS domain S-box protein [Actinomycetota bacterium]|nr:PAS domain S-box protein [Actinomycetota bacterium]
MTADPVPRVLLVDDRPDNLMALQAVLEPLGLDLTTVTSGEEALRRLLGEEFALIVLDVQMPGLDGFGTARLIKLREKTRHIPIIFLTAISGAEEHHLEGYASGAIDYVYKPFEPAILRAKVAALVELVGVRERLEREVAERTASEQRLAERERQLAEAESLAHVGAWHQDPFSGAVDWSDELFRIFGLAPGSVPVEDGTYLGFVHPDDRERVREALHRAVRTGEPYLVEHRAVRADGSMAWIRAQGHLVPGETGPGKLFGAAQDITQRKRAEEEFTQFFNLSLDLMAVAGLDGSLRRANRSFGRLLGWSEEELRSLNCFDLVYEEDRAGVHAGFAALRAGKELTDREVRMLDRAGRPRWFRVSARPVPEDGVAYLVAIDITERKRAAMLLAESEERYRALVEHAPEAIVVLDLEAGQFVDVNPQAERLFGMGRAELCGIGPSEVSQSRDATAAWIQRALSGGTDPFEWVLQDAKGRSVLCEVRFLPLPASGRKLARGSLIDITERRRVDEAAAAIAERERALRQTQKIAQTLQRSLLPELLPEIPGIGLAARYLPGSAGLEVGGDWYDVVPMPSGAVGLAIGDVVGRGLRAAVTMGQLRTALRAYALEDSSPLRVLERIGGLATGLPEAEMTTLVYAVYEPEAGMLRYLCAGHPPPLLIHPGGGTSFLEGGRVMPLGVPAVTMSEGIVALEPGSVLVFYTDGLIERPGAKIDDGMRDLAEAAQSVSGATPDAMCEAIIAAMYEDSAPRDDVALLVVACGPALADRFRLSVTTDPHHLGPLRQALSRWLSHVGASPDERRDIILAVSEAVTNSMVHAYGYEDGMVDVEARGEGEGVTVTVRDTGNWRFRETSSGGRGLLLMRALVETCDVAAGPGGTEVRLHRRLGRPMEPNSNGAGAPPEVAARRPEVGAGVRPGGGPGDDDLIVVAHLVEDIDVSNADRVAASLAGSVRKEQWGMVVDMSQLGYLDSSGIRLLFDIKRRLERRRQAMWVVVAPGSPVQQVLDLTRVGGIFHVATAVEDAVAAIGEEMRAVSR